MTGFAAAWNAYLCAMYGHAYSWTGGNTHPLAEVPVGAVCSRCGYVYQPRVEGGETGG